MFFLYQLQRNPPPHTWPIIILSRGANLYNKIKYGKYTYIQSVRQLFVAFVGCPKVVFHVQWTFLWPSQSGALPHTPLGVWPPDPLKARARCSSSIIVPQFVSFLGFWGPRIIIDYVLCFSFVVGFVFTLVMVWYRSSFVTAKCFVTVCRVSQWEFELARQTPVAKRILLHFEI